MKRYASMPPAMDVPAVKAKRERVKTTAHTTSHDDGNKNEVVHGEYSTAKPSS
jgi:hypothetical protein